jgi:dissimilatory sulfite reductase (desulfoviridin) alpha/beta subunit
MPSRPLTPEQEACAQELAQAIRAAAEDEILQIARTLAATDDRHLFGSTEFRIRDLVHRIGAKAYAAHLAGKKTATKAPASPAPTATTPPRTTATGPGPR